MNKIYLAGPFFNDAQNSWMDKLESKCEQLKVPYFSPRKAGYDIKDGWRTIFNADWKNILKNDLVLANINWDLPENQELMIASSEFNQYKDICNKPHGIEVAKFPDSGTIWEIGFAYGNKIPAIAYSQKPINKINLMITESVENILIGEQEIFKFLEYWTTVESFESKY